MAKRKRRQPEQVVKALQEGEAMLAAGKFLAEVQQKLEFSEATWMRRKKRYGGMKSDEAKAAQSIKKAPDPNGTGISLKLLWRNGFGSDLWGWS